MQNNGSRPFRTAAVLGAGVMGAQIAAHLANAGLTVHLLDIAADGHNRNQIVEANFAKAKKLKPDPFFTSRTSDLVLLGNFDDDFERLRDVDWIIEAVIEKLDVKRQLMKRVEATASAHAVVSTNTSGIPIHLIARDRSESFRKRFLGTHFFNPPRYLKLLELIPSPDTSPVVLERIARFGRLNLGKGVVTAKDTPAFIANRIGTYALMQHIRMVTDGSYTIEEVDLLTGPLTGRPRSATFRTADLVGLDTLVHVTDNLYDAVPHDESREAFKVPSLLGKLVEEGRLGAKTDAGFYRKEGDRKKSVNAESLQYESPDSVDLGDVNELKGVYPLGERLRTLFKQQDRAGAFFRKTTLDVLGYTARRIPEISDNPADIDRALSWGFGWKLGPFEIWDAIGFDVIIGAFERSDISVPEWVHEMRREGVSSFYKGRGTTRRVYVPDRGYLDDPIPVDELSVSMLNTATGKPLWQTKEAALHDVGEGVGLFEFRSYANTMSRGVIEGLLEVMEIVEGNPDIRGLVIGNDGDNFAVGANLGEVLVGIRQRQFDLIEGMIEKFQKAMQRVHYSTKPVVPALQGRVLGGGCELAMACTHPVAASESYVGLVELGVGLIPAGTGTMRMTAYAAAKAPSEHPSHVQAGLRRAFETIAMAEVAESSPAAVSCGFLPPTTAIVMNAARRLYVAREQVIRLSNQGYVSPPVQSSIFVLGRAGRAQFEQAVYNMRQSRFISDYDGHLAVTLANVMTGGDLTGPSHVHEDYLLDLEREAFMSLLGETKTQERIAHMLKNRKPLRN